MLIGKGFGCWNTMPTFTRSAFASPANTSSPSISIRPLGAHARHEVAHAVEHAQKRRFAAARRPDERGDLVFRDVERDVLERLEVVVPQVEVADADDGVVVRRLRGRAFAPARGDRRVRARLDCLQRFGHQLNLPVR